MPTRMLQVRWERHQAGILDHLRHLLASEAFVDVTLCCQGQRLRAHRLLLSACSPYLQRVLLEHPTSDHVTIILHDILHEDMCSLLQFMYSGSVIIRQEQMSSFLRAAETLDVKVLARTEQTSGAVFIQEYDPEVISVKETKAPLQLDQLSPKFDDSNAKTETSQMPGTDLRIQPKEHASVKGSYPFIIPVPVTKDIYPNSSLIEEKDFKHSDISYKGNVIPSFINTVYTTAHRETDSKFTSNSERTSAGFQIMPNLIKSSLVSAKACDEQERTVPNTDRTEEVRMPQDLSRTSIQNSTPSTEQGPETCGANVVDYKNKNHSSSHGHHINRYRTESMRDLCTKEYMSSSSADHKHQGRGNQFKSTPSIVPAVQESNSNLKHVVNEPTDISTLPTSKHLEQSKSEKHDVNCASATHVKRDINARDNERVKIGFTIKSFLGPQSCDSTEQPEASDHNARFTENVERSNYSLAESDRHTTANNEKLCFSKHSWSSTHNIQKITSNNVERKKDDVTKVLNTEPIYSRSHADTKVSASNTSDIERKHQSNIIYDERNKCFREGSPLNEVKRDKTKHMITCTSQESNEGDKNTNKTHQNGLGRPERVYSQGPNHNSRFEIGNEHHIVKNDLEEYYKRNTPCIQDKQFKGPLPYPPEIPRGIHLVRPMPSLRPISHLTQYNGQVVTNYDRPNGFLPTHSPVKLSSYYVSDIVPEFNEHRNKDTRSHILIAQSKSNNVMFSPYFKDSLPGRTFGSGKDNSGICVNGFQKPVFGFGGLPVGLGCTGNYQRIPPRLSSIVPPSPWAQHQRPPCAAPTVPAPRRLPSEGQYPSNFGWTLPTPMPALTGHVPVTDSPASPQAQPQPFAKTFSPITVNLTTRETACTGSSSPKLKQLLTGTEIDHTSDKQLSRKRISEPMSDVTCRAKEKRSSYEEEGTATKSKCLPEVRVSTNDEPLNADTPEEMCASMMSNAIDANDSQKKENTAINLTCQNTNDIVKTENESCDIVSTNVNGIPALVASDSNNNGKDPGKTHGCEDCGKNFSRRQLLLQHRRIHTGERPYACTQCGKQFTQRGHWSTHQKLHEPARSPEHACSSCGKAFGSRASLKVHLRTHTGEKPFQCTECGKQFSQLRNYKYHRSVHEGTREFAATCPECGKYFNDRGYLSSHMKIHRNRKEYGCQYCGKSFNQRVAYNMHVRIHTGERPHSCPHCSKSFSRKMLLKQHLRIHTGEKPFACEVCGKAFADRSNMTLHMRLHSGIKPYTCNVCSKAFTKKHHLKTHMNYHTGIKPYACSKCGLRFSQSSNMRTHFKKCAGGNNDNTTTNTPPSNSGSNLSNPEPAAPSPGKETTSTPSHSSSTSATAVITPPQSDESSCGSNSVLVKNGTEK